MSDVVSTNPTDIYVSVDGTASEITWTTSADPLIGGIALTGSYFYYVQGVLPDNTSQHAFTLELVIDRC